MTGLSDEDNGYHPLFLPHVKIGYHGSRVAILNTGCHLISMTICSTFNLYIKVDSIYCQFKQINVNFFQFNVHSLNGMCIHSIQCSLIQFHVHSLNCAFYDFLCQCDACCVGHNMHRLAEKEKNSMYP